jgi:lipoyl-dependent peroxiredoxin
MGAIERSADVVWEGSLTKGGGTLDLVSSGAAAGLPVSWASRTERAAGKTSPEELLAAAHASCFSMALSHELAEAGTPPDRLEVTATYEAGLDGGLAITGVRLQVRGKVPGVDADGFRAKAEAAKSGCPVSRAISPALDLTVEASLME